MHREDSLTSPTFWEFTKSMSEQLLKENGINNNPGVVLIGDWCIPGLNKQFDQVADGRLTEMSSAKNGIYHLVLCLHSHTCSTATTQCPCPA